MKVDFGLQDSRIHIKQLNFFLDFSRLLGGALPEADPELRVLARKSHKGNVSRRKQLEMRSGTGKKMPNQGSISKEVSNSACVFMELLRIIQDNSV